MASEASRAVERNRELGEQVEEGAKAIDARQTLLTKVRYDRQAKSYDRRSALMERFIFGKLRSWLWSQVCGTAVLEVGVGTGANFPFYPREAQVIGIDLSDQMLAQAGRRAEQEGVTVQLLEMDTQDLRFPPATFDSAVTTMVFCSVPDPVLGLSEVRRVLKPGGRFVMIEHVRPAGPLGPLFDLLNPLVVRTQGANINRRTVENVRKAGFELESVESRFGGIVKLIVARKGQESQERRSYR